MTPDPWRTDNGSFFEEEVVKRSPLHGRASANLSESVHRRLNAYALAASAAGVGLLAMEPRAAAKIVYTPTHKVISDFAHTLYIDLDHDDVDDFLLCFCYSGQSDGSTAGIRMYQAVYHEGLNGVVGKGYYASALRSGVRVGPGGQFHVVGNMASVVNRTSKGTFYFRGPWANHGKGVKDRYLGLRFMIKGKVHYGWARVTTQFDSRHLPEAILTGYAYETIPRTPIIAGKTMGPDESGIDSPNASLTSPDPQAATLGMLALGAPALYIWRREEAVGRR